MEIRPRGAAPDAFPLKFALRLPLFLKDLFKGRADLGAEGI